MQLFVNNIETALGADITNIATSLTINEYANLPSPTGDDYFLLTLCKRDGNGIETSIEIVKCTGRSGNVLTIVRGWEDSTSYAYSAGDIVSLRLTAGTLNDNLMQYDQTTMSIGRINNPLLHLPLKTGLFGLAGAGEVTLTRDSVATYIDRYGVVQDAAIDEARFEAEGLLMEGGSTNKCLHSEDLSNALWLKTRVTLETAITSPDGTVSDAYKVVVNTDNNTHYLNQSLAKGAEAVTYSFSVFLKKAEYTDAVVRLQGLYPAKVDVPVDLSAGALGTVTYDTFTDCSASIQKLDNDWYRIKCTFTTDNNTTLMMAVFLGANTGIYTGDGISGIYVWGAQLEELPFASSYIPTTDAPVTRNADACKIDFEGNMPNSVTENLTILCDANSFGIYNNQAMYGHGGTGLLFFRINRSDTETMNTRYGSEMTAAWAGDTNMHRYGFIFDSSVNKQSAYFDSNRVLGPLDASYVGNSNYFYLGSRDAASVDPLYGHISNFRIYDVALTADEMRIA